MTIGKRITGVFLAFASLATEVGLIWAAIGEANGGHGTYFIAKTFFPFTMLLAVPFSNIGFVATALALLQFPTYGWILWVGLERGRFWRFVGVLVLIHLAAAWLALHVGGEVFPS